MTFLSTENAEALPDTLVVLPGAAERFSTRRAYAQTFAATAAIRCLGVVSGVLAARLLGPVGRGELAVIIFLPTLLIALGELELPRSLAYEASKAEEIRLEVVATGFWLGLGLGCLQAVVLAATLPFVLPTNKLYLLPASKWFMLYLPATYVGATLMGIDQGRGRFGRFAVFQALPGVLYVLAILLVWFGGRISPQAFAFGILAGAVLTALARASMDRDAILRASPSWRAASRLMKRGLSYYLPMVVGLALMRTDMLLVVRLAPAEAIGLYVVAQAIAMGQIGAVNPFIQVGFTAVAGEAEPQQALQTLARHFRMAQLAVFTMGIATAAVTPWVIRLLFGPQFAAAITTAYLLIGATVLWGMEQVLEQGLRAAGHPRPGIVSNLLGLAVLVGLGIPGCVDYGIAGIAAAALAAQLLNLAILIGFCVFSLKMPARSFWAFEAGTPSTIALSLKSSWDNFYKFRNV